MAEKKGRHLLAERDINLFRAAVESLHFLLFPRRLHVEYRLYLRRVGLDPSLMDEEP